MRGTEGKKYGQAEGAWLMGFGAVLVREGLAEGTMRKDLKDLKGYIHDSGQEWWWEGAELRTAFAQSFVVNSHTVC